jgi:hypothetical protein
MFQVFDAKTGKALTKQYANWVFARRFIDRAVNTDEKRAALGAATIAEARAMFEIRES